VTFNIAESGNGLTNWTYGGNTGPTAGLFTCQVTGTYFFTYTAVVQRTSGSGSSAVSFGMETNNPGTFAAFAGSQVSASTLNNSVPQVITQSGFMTMAAVGNQCRLVFTGTGWEITSSGTTIEGTLQTGVTVSCFWIY
jgi:hypothetical protein